MSKPLEGGGDHGLEPVVKNDNADVDIIAVHGLGADSRYSWRFQPKKDGKVIKGAPVVNWLKDEGLLPSEIPNARVLAFNYHSNWAPGTTGTKIDIWALGQELMREICVDREGKNEQERQRPIIFIGHSFGGIVIEQGLVLACAAMSKEKLVPRCTVGIISLGVPHQGSASAAWGTTIARLGNILSFDSEKGLIEDLQQGSKILKPIVNQFLMWVSKYSVELAQFYETEKTNYGSRFGIRWNEMVVSESSACLPGFQSIPLPTDHLKMAKFDGPHNPCYKKIIPVLKRMAKEAPEKAKLRFAPRAFIQDNSQIPAVHLECQRALFISFPDAELQGVKRRLGARTPETCEWLIVKDSYMNWLALEAPQVLRMSGEPGMGKTMIVTFLIEQLTEKLGATPDMTLAFHFCDNKNQSTNTATAVTRAILFQLFQQRPKHFHFLQKAYDIQGNELFKHFDKLWSILIQVIESFGEGDLFILIDALDECDEKSRKLICQGLEDISKNSKLKLRLFLTCRPELDIEKHFTGKNVQTVSFKMQLDDINKDLQRYMDDKVPEICHKQGWGLETEKRIKTTLMNNANGIFLWCSFVIKDIEELEAEYELDHTLKNLPEDLAEVYRRILHNIKTDAKPAAKMILEVIAGARRPLKVDELTMCYVLAEDSPHAWGKDDLLNSTMPDQKYRDKYNGVYIHCGRMLRHDEITLTINLVHQSAKDYLLNTYLKTEDQPENEKTNVRLNNLFLEITYRYFSLQYFDHLAYRMVFDSEWNIDWESNWWELDPSPAYLVYAGREWEAHAQDAETHPTRGMGRFAKYLTKKRRAILNSWLRKVAMSGNQDFAVWLLKQDADINASDFRGWTPFQLAARHEQVKILPFLKEKGALIDATPEIPLPYIDGRSPLQIAAEKGFDDVIEELLRLGANIDAPPANIHGRTALQAAAEKGRIETVQLLIDRGADPNVGGAVVSGVTALLAGAGSGGEWQMGKNIHRTIKQRSRLPGSAEIDTQKIAEEDQQDRDKRREEEESHEKVVVKLVNAKAQVIPNQFNWSALHAAVERESDIMVKKMLSIKGVDINITGDHDGTPLHSAKAKANEELAKLFKEKDGEDPCLYSKLDLDAMMKYIRAVLTRLMTRSNTERFFFIQSYIPIYHVIYSYCAEGADDMHDKPPVGLRSRRGELVYRGVDAWLKSYVKWLRNFINETPKCNDFLTVYLREWKLFKRGAYYVGRMLRYLTRHWVKHQHDELGHKDVHEIAELFLHRWRTGMTKEVRAHLRKDMTKIQSDIDRKVYVDDRVLVAINESLGGKWQDYKQVFERARVYFQENFKKLDWNDDKDFEVELRHLSDEFEVESEVWAKGATDPAQTIFDNKREQLLEYDECWTEEAADYYLKELEPYFLAPYSGGKEEEIKERVNALWDMLRHDDDEAERRRQARQKNIDATTANADIGAGAYQDGDTHMANGIKETPIDNATAAHA